MYGDQYGEFVCGYMGMKALLVPIPMTIRCF